MPLVEVVDAFSAVPFPVNRKGVLRVGDVESDGERVACGHRLQWSLGNGTTGMKPPVQTCSTGIFSGRIWQPAWPREQSKRSTTFLFTTGPAELPRRLLQGRIRAPCLPSLHILPPGSHQPLGWCHHWPGGDEHISAVPPNLRFAHEKDGEERRK